MCATWQATKVTRNARVPLSGETPLLNRKREGGGKSNRAKAEIRFNRSGLPRKALRKSRRSETPPRAPAAPLPALPPPGGPAAAPGPPAPCPGCRSRTGPAGSSGMARAQPPGTRGHRARAGSGGATATASCYKPCPSPSASPVRASPTCRGDVFYSSPES